MTILHSPVGSNFKIGPSPDSIAFYKKNIRFFFTFVGGSNVGVVRSDAAATIITLLEKVSKKLLSKSSNLLAPAAVIFIGNILFKLSVFLEWGSAI